MEQAAECFSTHIIQENGTFDASAVDEFEKQAKLQEYGESYVVVSIIGQQSSGKSTFLNELFYTNFKEMNALAGRSRTTKGIWIARCPGIEPPTIVMDVEGTDGKEKEGDTAFEKQSALFALAVSDIVLINLWCNNLGTHNAANRPLLETVFQAMLKLFNPRKTTLMFVLRDKTSTPLEILESYLSNDVLEIWNSMPKPERHNHTPLDKFFNVEVVALPNYGDKQQFKNEVARLRQKFFHSTTPGGLLGDRLGVLVPASAFSFTTQQIWKDIKDNKDLDLPSYKVLCATVVCEKICNEKNSKFLANEVWLRLQKAARSHLEPGFRESVISLYQNCLSSYDEEAYCYVDSVRSAKRRQLKEKLSQHVLPMNKSMLKHIRSEKLEKFKNAVSDALNGGQGFALVTYDAKQEFKKQFDDQCEANVIMQADWGFTSARDQFSRDLDSHLAEVRTAKLSELTAAFERSLEKALYNPVEVLLSGGSYDTWHAIRELLDREIRTVVPEFVYALSSFDTPEEEKENMVSKLKNFSRGVVEERAREQAKHVLPYMVERFTSEFKRIESENKDVQAIIENAKSSSLKVLSDLAAIRLDRNSDTIEETLFHSFLRRDINSPDSLSSSAWEKVPLEYTLITPVQCNSLWNDFIRKTEFMITQANKVANANSNWFINFLVRIKSFIGNVAAYLRKHAATTRTVLGIITTLLYTLSFILGVTGHAIPAAVLSTIAKLISILTDVLSLFAMA